MLNLLKKNLQHYWRTNLAIVAGCMLSAAVLTGALLLGDAVRFSLLKLVDDRLGKASFALDSRDRFFRAHLAEDMANDLQTPVCAALKLDGTLSLFDGSGTVNGVQVMGADKHFWSMSPSGKSWDLAEDDILVNRSLAHRLKVQAGDEVLVRVSKPGFVPRESPLSNLNDLTVTMRLRVKAVMSVAEFGRFNLRANQVPPHNAFVSHKLLTEKLELGNRANLLLAVQSKNEDLSVDFLQQSLQKHWRLDDIGLEIRPAQAPARWELRSRRIFLEDQIVQAADNLPVDTVKILTYFVNGICKEDRFTPYSMVTALEQSPSLEPLLADMQAGDIVINEWLAEDLNAKPGDRITLRYFISKGMRQLEEEASTFQVRKIVPLAGWAADPCLMPAFAGLQDVENCRDWEAGIPVDFSVIRSKDETYWEHHRGTPKAFICLAAGREMWSNRFGSLTAIRITDVIQQPKLETLLLNGLSPEQSGLSFLPVREIGEKAGRQAMDFSQLFLGLSFFLIVSALLLTGLLFVLGIEQRLPEIGLLRATGWQMNQVRSLLLAEGGLLSFLGAAVGVPAGIVYTKIMLWALATMWQEAVGSTTIHFFWTPGSLLIGFLAGFILSLIVIILVFFRKSRHSVRMLLQPQATDNLDVISPTHPRRFTKPATAFIIIIALALTGLGVVYPDKATGIFFLAGALLLAGFVLLCSLLLNRRSEQRRQAGLNLNALAWQSIRRRHNRTLAVIALLACGCFMVVAVGANRRDPWHQARQRFSGTGGFAFWAESTVPIYYDLNDPATLKELGLIEEMKDVRVISMRMRAGDDATCLNINRAQQPRVLGVDPAALHNLKAFSFSGVDFPGEMNETDTPWQLLNQNININVIPAIADASSIQWSMGKKLGDRLEYTDDSGRRFYMRLTAGLQNSILQGSVIISEAAFIRRFPDSPGYHRFLIDCPEDRLDIVANVLSKQFRQEGLLIMPTTRRLAALYAMEHTYLSMFQILGSLGLILGCVGLSVVIARNILERRRELAMLRAVGFEKGRIKNLLFREHAVGLIFGIASGSITAFLAVTPALRGGGGQSSWGQLLATIALILLFGLISVWASTGLTLRGKLLDALRNE